jgi:hypothetical protein
MYLVYIIDQIHQLFNELKNKVVSYEKTGMNILSFAFF